MKVEQTEEFTYCCCKKVGRKGELTKDLPIEEVHCELHDEDCQYGLCDKAMKSIGKQH